MCYSATVSFASSAALAAVGFIGTYCAIKSSKKFLALNMIPLFYAIQQFSEGMIWIGSPFLSSQFWGILFLFFAFFVYPWYVGLSCYLISRRHDIKKKIAWVASIGFVYGVLLFSNVLLTSDLGLDQCHFHILYHIKLLGDYEFTNSVMYISIAIYVFLTSAPFFLSDRRYLFIVGWAIVLSSIASWIIYSEYFVSIWCFYAAIIALCITLVTCWKGKLS